jgi:hypothetical protein
MDKINLRDYCMIGFNNIDEILEDIQHISENDINYISGDGLILLTFKSSFNVYEIEDILKTKGRYYLLFELNIGFFSASLMNKETEKKLFGSEVDMSPFLKIEEQLNQLKNDMVEKYFNKSDEELLEEAIQNEDYETAAKIRDKLNSKNE